MLTRFDKFERTTLYTNFKHCLTWTVDNVEPEQMEMYKNNLEFLRTTFESIATPNEDQMDFYIDAFESIDDNNIPDFKILIAIIFEKSLDSHHACRTIVKKNTTNEKKQNDKAKIMHIKQLTKEQQQADKEEQRRLKGEHKEQEKNRKKRETEIFNNTVIKCICGLDYIRCKKKYHITSSRHEYRLEGMNYLADPEVYKQYTSGTCMIDNKSAISINDDMSSISSNENI
jgi:hypothetical protein